MRKLRECGNRFLMFVLMLLAVAAVGILSGPVKVEASETVTVGDYTYTITDGTAVLSSYNGTASSVTVPTSMTYNGVTYKIRTIGANAFDGNVYIQTLVIPEGITNLGTCAFKNCTSLTSITINANLGDMTGHSIQTVGSSGNQYQDNSAFYNVGANADSLTVTFGSSVTYVPAYLFATGSSASDGVYAHVTSVTFSNSVTEVGAYAFYNCYDMTTLTMGSGLTTIGSYSFANCTSLKTISWGSGLQTIRDRAFYGNTSLTSVSLPSKVTTVEGWAFEACTNLKTVVLPKSTTSLGVCAFKNCTALSSITINGNLGDMTGHSIQTVGSSGNQYMDNSAFYNAGANADSLTVTFGSSVTYVPAYLFATGSSASDGVYAHVTSVTFSNSVTEVGAYAFYNCYDMTTLTMGSGLTTIGSYSFANCTGLKNISWGSALQTIGDRAFYGNTSLTSVSLPSKVTTVEGWAFEACTNLKTVVLPKSTTSLGVCAFKNCTALSSITINGNLGDMTGHSIQTVGSSGNQYMDNSAFYNAGANADSLTVTFGSSVTYVPAYLFATGASTSDNVYAHITSVKISSKVTAIGNYAFYHCYDLKTVTLNCSGLTIGDNSFGDVTATVYYASPNASWTSALRTNYGGTLTWKAKFMSGAKMKFSSVENTKSGVKLTWKKVSAATGYKIYRKTSGGSYSLVKTISKNSTLSWTDKDVSSGKSYTYCIKAYNSSVTSSYTAKSFKYLKAGAVKSISNTSSGVKITWTKVSGASGYYIYRKAGSGSYKKIATVKSGSTVTYTNKTSGTYKVANGTTYTYYVIPYYKNSSGTVTKGSYSATKKTVYLSTTSISSLKNSSSKKMKVTWAKNSKATGYQIQYSTSKSFASGNKTVTVTSKATVSKTIGSLKKGKTYYVRVRSYKTVGDTKYTSAWSGKKSVKISK